MCTSITTRFVQVNKTLQNTPWTTLLQQNVRHSRAITVEFLKQPSSLLKLAEILSPFTVKYLRLIHSSAVNRFVHLLSFSGVSHTVFDWAPHDIVMILPPTVVISLKEPQRA